LRELKVVALTVHPDTDGADAVPGVEPRAQRVERAVIRWHRQGGEPERRHEESAALVAADNRSKFNVALGIEG
jgi:hypothetical protein